MHHLLLVLLLISPRDQALGDRVAEDIRALLGTQGRVLVGAPAATELSHRGLRDGDLLSAPEVGEAMTQREPDVVLVRLESRRSGGDDIIDSAVWLRGHLQRHVAIAGGGHAASDGATRGVIEALAPLLEQDAASDTDEARLPQLAQDEDWRGLLARVDPFGPPSPHQSARALYYAVLANVRLGRLEHAQEVLERLRARYPDHVLTQSAAALLPGAAAAAPPSGDR